MARKPTKHRPSGTDPGRMSGQGELRIIGGDWRSRKLRFPDAGGVRPTPARTRETLFNWLNFHLAGARCLDLFAGSGVLGLEALSRGADSATLVDHTPALAKALRDNLRQLGARRAEVVCQDVAAFLAERRQPPFDIVFMDPPFRQGWLERLIPLLDAGQWLRPGGWIYLEYESERTPPRVPADWHLHRQKTAGQVTYALYRIDGDRAAAAGPEADS
ncbi:16S rRNA (guanine(966)-N(2))-methyltransferase RsmD [Marinobacter lutaoensis]|uniref:Ribosomal RNA small subunit methyltransferase D n=1 Tax=Marinobacter lutaoensis TaxID=135739 RepID=A0A1V2DP23_9GAMM|nr:16S rRNA (guanine(966)-N(2))-methyltransferase RsmD [Marinobacter lutaoensis]MBE02303.1 16S rRNA (guanine(966)-N(2))-methyltransferase RsmD [Marinobacter sp.]MBI43811.1 16S rRNA (guanine(966)-N(2))-methyltransferase RsmD [Oceanospirillales bacterium]NVD35667.1 16S rRNA (guanine(966)-N(2))-methyltransferase RsmD [Marinobacter lutaoensis]ONF42259.1 16S rRNA (guanine(966)-N(2))-methyltransferase RsmD [Marinobacter lutaoensis]